MRIKSILIISLAVAILPTIHAQQLPHRSPLGVLDFTFNPAITALDDDAEFGAFFRQQWIGFAEAPRTGNIFGQYPFEDYNMSVGGALGYDRTGPLKRIDLTLTYSYHLELGDGQLSLGLLARLGNYQLDGTNTIATDADDNLLLTNRSSSILPNFGIGVYYVSNLAIYDASESGFFVGISTNQLLPNNLKFVENEFTNLQRVLHTTTVLGGRIVNSSGFVEPSLWLHYNTENILYGIGNVIYEMEEVFWTGLSISSDFSTSIQGGVILPSGIRTGILSGYSLGRIGRYQGFTFELILSYRFNV